MFPMICSWQSGQFWLQDGNPMILAALPKRISPSPDQLEEIGTGLIAIILQQKLKIFSELLCFLQKDGIFNRSRYWKGAKDVSARLWWKSQFNCALSQLAQKLLSVMPKSGSAERNWSPFGYIH
ncbi:hypothetical protein V1504DRAFT_461115 [Lipomyces starkeyi]